MTEPSPALYIRCGCGTETDIHKALSEGEFFKSQVDTRLHARVGWVCSGCGNHLGFTVSDVDSGSHGAAEPPDMDLVRQIVYQTKKAIQAGRTRFSFGYHGHGGVVEISPTGDGSK